MTSPFDLYLVLPNRESYRRYILLALQAYASLAIISFGINVLHDEAIKQGMDLI